MWLDFCVQLKTALYKKDNRKKTLGPWSDIELNLQRNFRFNIYIYFFVLLL